jgi:hypothetical protein
MIGAVVKLRRICAPEQCRLQKTIVESGEVLGVQDDMPVAARSQAPAIGKLVMLPGSLE